MSIVNIQFRENTYTLACNDEEKIQKLAERFNSRAEKLAFNLKNKVTDNKLAIITGIMLEDELERTEEHAKIPKGISETEVASAISKTLDQISEYIEGLASKLETE